MRSPRPNNKQGGNRALPISRQRIAATGIKTVWYWHKKKKTNADQRNRIASTEINPSTCGQLVHDKGGKNIQQRKSLFNKRCWGNWTPTCKRIKLENSLIPYTRVNSKCIKGIRPDTLKLLEGSPHVTERVKNPTSICKDAGLIPGLAQ